MSVDYLKLLDIHYCILIKRYGSKKALDIMKEILPKNYEHEIELDENDISGYNKMKESRYSRKSPGFRMQLGHCRNKWKMNDQLCYLRDRIDETEDDIYGRIIDYQQNIRMLTDHFNGYYGVKFIDIDASVEDEYMKLIGED